MLEPAFLTCLVTRQCRGSVVRIEASENVLDRNAGESGKQIAVNMAVCAAAFEILRGMQAGAVWSGLLREIPEIQRRRRIEKNFYPRGRRDRVTV